MGITFLEQFSYWTCLGNVNVYIFLKLVKIEVALTLKFVQNINYFGNS